jgi:hypothetical protein
VLSRCQRLIHLDLSNTGKPFCVLDLLRVVSTLSYLKKFHFPDSGCTACSGPDERRGEDAPIWPNSLDTFHISSSLDVAYLIAFNKAPASLKCLIVEDGDKEPDYAVLDTVFDLIGSRILTLKIDYEAEPIGQLCDIFKKFPNLLYLEIRAIFIYDEALPHMDLEANHPLCRVTMLLDHLDDIFSPYFLYCLEDLLNRDWLPNIRSLRLSNEPSLYRWAFIFQELPLPIADIQPSSLLDIGRRLKQRSSSASSIKESGVWLVDGKDNDAVICEYTEEDISRMMSGARV